MNNTLQSFKKRNSIYLTTLIASLLVVCILFSLNTYEFNATVFEKKSANTFVGDEIYNQITKEIDSIEKELVQQGHEVTRQEEVTERTNSKGEKTSLIKFSLVENFKKNTWSFLTAGMTSSTVLLIIVILMIASVLFAIVGTIKSIETDYVDLKKKDKLFRSLSSICLLLAMLLIPVFVMTNTVAMSRKVTLYKSGLATEGKDELYVKLDNLLFNGAEGDNISTALSNLQFKNLGMVWFAIPCLFAALLSSLKIRYGSAKHTLARGALYSFIISICIITLYPYYVMLITGFRSSAETNDMYFQNIFPVEWMFSNMSNIVQRGVLQYLLNSLFIAGGATLIAMICGIPAAYAMARMKFKGKKGYLGFIIMSQMFAPVVLLVGIYQLMSAINLNDSIIGLMLINAAFNQAFAIWLLRGTFIAISPEMEQAARIDGCTTFGSLWHVLLPMAAPGIVTALIFVFINAWNEYTISTVLITTAAKKPITVGITQFSSFNMIEWQYLFAASLLATIPVVILFISIEKHLTSGLTSGGVKG